MSRRPEAAPIAGASIRVVATRTGIAAETLRKWESRYGFPQPKRQRGGSRVYAEPDVARLHLVVRALEAGFRPGEVVPLDADEITRLIAAAARDTTSAEPSVVPSIAALMAAVAGDDSPGLRSALRSAAAVLGPKRFVTEIAQPLMVQVGASWAEGRLAVRHEHLATACVSNQLHVLRGAIEEATRGRVVLLATLPGERHLLGLEMAATYLAANGDAPRVLGAESPVDEIAASARAMKADVVGVSISPTADAVGARRAVKQLRRAVPPACDVWMGGVGAARLKSIEGVTSFAAWD